MNPPVSAVSTAAAAAVPQRPVRSLRARLRLSPRWAPYVLLAPFLVLFVVFGLYPLLFSLYLAFQSWEPTSGLQAIARGHTNASAAERPSLSATRASTAKPSASS